MNIVRRFALLLLGTFLAISSANANEILLKHVLATSQSMSALYMKSLSEGSEKYQRDFDRYKRQSETLLDQYVRQGGEQAGEFLKMWQSFEDNLKVIYSDDFGWAVDQDARRDFRSYHSKIFKLLDSKKSVYETSKAQLLLAATQLEAMSARFFDISSTYNGVFSLSSKEAAIINPIKISEEFKNSLTRLAQKSDDEAFKKRLMSAKYKWEFVEEGVVSYSDQSALFLVYATKNKINKALIKS